MFWSGKWECEVLITFLTLNTTEAQHSSPVNHPHQTGAALLLHLFNPGHICISHSFVSFHLRSILSQIFAEDVPNRIIQAAVDHSVTGTRIHPWKKLMPICVCTNLYTLPHTPLLSSAPRKPCPYRGTHGLSACAVPECH